MAAWAAASPRARLGTCMEIVDRLYDGVFETAQAVMHTAGQSAPMSYAGSGTNALDRGVEALAYAQAAMAEVPAEALWERRFGSTTIRLRKRYRLVPRGVAVCFACATFPTWNAYPAMLASLATGNAVIVKPHPTAILPMALAVRTCREVLAEAGFSPDLVTLCVDDAVDPVGKRLVKHPQAAIVDFTGSARFGAWVEAQRASGAVLLRDLGRQHGGGRVGRGAGAGAAQPRDDDEPVLGADVHLAAERLRAARRHPLRRRGASAPTSSARRSPTAIGAIADDPRRAAPIMAAIQSPGTPALIDEMAGGGRAARARAARLGAVRARRVPAGAHAHAAAARRRGRARAISTARSASGRSAS